MLTGEVFEIDKVQVVSLPGEARLPNHVKTVEVIVVGNERVLRPIAWDEFFLSVDMVSNDFMTER